MYIIIIIKQVNWCFTPSQPVRLYQGDTHVVIYTAESRAILLALKHVHCSKRKSFLILSDTFIAKSCI